MSFVKLEDLGKSVMDTEEQLQRAQELYDREPTRAHRENLREARYEHSLFLKSKRAR